MKVVLYRLRASVPKPIVTPTRTVALGGEIRPVALGGELRRVPLGGEIRPRRLG